MKKLFYKVILSSFIWVIPFIVSAQVFPLDVTISTTSTSIKYTIKNTTNQTQSYKYSIGSQKNPDDFAISNTISIAPGGTKSGSLSTKATPNTKYDVTFMVVDTNKEIISEKKLLATTKTGTTPPTKTDPQSTPPTKTDPQSTPPTKTDPAGGEEPMGLEDPIGEGVTIDGLISKLLDIIVTVGTPLVAFFFILTGFKYVSAQGNEEKLKSAKSAAIGTVIGAICVLGAWTFAQAIKGSIEDLRSALDIIRFL